MNDEREGTELHRNYHDPFPYIRHSTYDILIMLESAEERTLDALGNSVRRTIMRLLVSGPKPVGAIAQELPVSRPAVSKHLRILEGAELVIHEQEGTRNLFRLNPAGFDAARRWLDSFWDEALNRFAAIAEEETGSKQRKTG